MRKILLLLFVVLICSLTGCRKQSTKAPEITEPSANSVIENATECTLIVDITSVESGAYLLEQERLGLIPFVKVLEVLDVSVENEKDDLIIFYCRGEMYSLDLSNKQLINTDITLEGNPINLIMKPPGSKKKSYFIIHNGDLFVDTDSISFFVEHIMEKKILIDWQQNLITIASGDKGTVNEDRQ